MAKRAKPKLWVTYAWADDASGDFTYLVQELASVGVEAKFDKISLTPGQRLWDQIGEQIVSGKLDAWAYLLTPQSLASKPCREELAYALYRCLQDKSDFPLIGLAHGVSFNDVPPSLAVRLCIPLDSPDWLEQVKAGLERRPPILQMQRKTHYHWAVHRPYLGNAAETAVEVRPRFGQETFWRFVLLADAKVLRWGHGPSGGLRDLMCTRQMSVEGGSFVWEGKQMQYFGSGDTLSPGTSAYVVLGNPLPQYVMFGHAKDPFGPPAQGECFTLQ